MNGQLNKELYALLNNTGLVSEKESLVIAFTNGREDSTKGLTDAEAKDFINYLRRQPSAKYASIDKMRKKIISMAHELGWHHLVNGKWEIDMKHVNDWCVKYSSLKKELNRYSLEELPALVSQFQQVYDSHLKKV